MQVRWAPEWCWTRWAKGLRTQRTSKCWLGIKNHFSLHLCYITMSDAGEVSAGTVLGKVREGFEGLENQPATSEKYSGLDTSPATYSVAKQLRDNDMELHTDKQVMFCGDTTSPPPQQPYLSTKIVTTIITVAISTARYLTNKGEHHCTLCEVLLKTKRLDWNYCILSLRVCVVCVCVCVCVLVVGGWWLVGWCFC